MMNLLFTEEERQIAKNLTAMQALSSCPTPVNLLPKYNEVRNKMLMGYK
jgi:hypothetical protein